MQSSQQVSQESEPDMKKYSFIMLIIYNDSVIYKRLRAIWEKYMNICPQIKCFFVQSLPNMSTHISYDESTSTIYVKGTESTIPGVLRKTIPALNYIDQNYTYDYIIRTNISTFWDFQKLLKYKFPKSLYGGVRCPWGGTDYASGTGIIMSQNLIKPLVENESKLNYKLYDDVSIGKFYASIGIKFIRLETRIDFVTFNKQEEFDAKYPNFEEFIQKLDMNVLNFRVKNKNRNQCDEYILTKLLHIIYHM